MPARRRCCSPSSRTPTRPQRAVAATRYPPEGVRGMAGMSRGSRFGTRPDYFKQRQRRRLRGAAARNAARPWPGWRPSPRCPACDALFVGPGDLSGAMGHVGQLTHPEVMALMADAARRAKALGMPIGTVGGTPELVAQLPRHRLRLRRRGLRPGPADARGAGRVGGPARHRCARRKRPHRPLRRPRPVHLLTWPRSTCGRSPRATTARPPSSTASTSQSAMASSSSSSAPAAAARARCCA